MKRISRRRFTKGLSAALAAGPLALSRMSLAQPPVVAPAVPPLSKLAVAEGKSPAALIDAVLDALGGIKTWVKPGHRVVVKPNIGWDRIPAMAANTNPQVVGQLVKLCKEAGAAEVLVFDRTCNDARRCYTSSGIAKAVEEAGGKTQYIRTSDLEHRFRTVPIPNGNRLKEWPIYIDALDADVYINVPIAKHHSLTRLSLGIKNTMGILGGDRGALHVDIGEKLADIHRAFRPTLTIMDAYRVLLRNGPTGGNPRDTKLQFTLIAGVDPVAVDAYTTTLFEQKPADVPYIPAGAAAGLGTDQLDRIETKQVKV